MRFLSYLVRPGIFLVLGLAAGYYFGYADAFREYDTIGAKVMRVVNKVDPNEARRQRDRRADVLRDTIRAKAGVVTPEG